jgi:hypothetical protein
VPDSNRAPPGATNQGHAECHLKTSTDHRNSVGGNTVRLHFRGELVLAQGLFDRSFSAVDPLQLEMVAASVGGRMALSIPGK